MAKHKVYASLEIADREVRLLVYEEFEGRFLVLQSEVVPCKGIEDFRITDQKKVVEAIKTAVEKAESALGYHISAVLLAIPSADVNRVSQNVEITIEDGTNHIRNFHIEQGIKRALEYEPADNEIFVNVQNISYKIAGIPWKKSPVGQESKSFEMDVTLLYANKEVVFSYVKAVEAAGLKVIDIFIDAYAQAQQTAAFSHSNSQAVILVDIQAKHTVLTLIHREKILSSTVLDKGFDYWIKPLRDKYQLKHSVCERLLNNLFSLSQEKDESIIFVDQNKDERYEISAKELAGEVVPNVRKWIADINEKCEPITSSVKARYILSGEGASFPILRDLAPAFSAPVLIYNENILGARNGKFITALGTGYAWMEKAKREKRDEISVDLNELETSIDSIGIKSETKGGITARFQRVVRSRKQ